MVRFPQQNGAPRMHLLTRNLPMAAVCLLGVSVGISSALARTLEVGPGKAYAKPSAAVAAASDGDRILILPGQYFDCAVVSASHLSIEGVGDAAGVVLTDKTCQGKALLVIEGNDDTIRNLTVTRARVADGNGAGIRAEGGNLTIEGVRFVNNQDGILTAGKPDMVLTVRHSFFEKNGVCGDYCAHAIYAARSPACSCRTACSATRATATTSSRVPPAPRLTAATSRTGRPARRAT